MGMRVEIEHATGLWFDDGLPVRAASAVARFGDGWLIVQDDATHAAWQCPGGIRPVRVLPAVGGHETFGSAEGTKHLKPDFEAACEVPGGVLLLGSGSSPARMRACLLRPTTGGTAFTVTDLTDFYHAVAAALGLAVDLLNLEGACVTGDRLRWFQRGNSAAGVPSASVDVDLSALLAALNAPHPETPDTAAPGPGAQEPDAHEQDAHEQDAHEPDPQEPDAQEPGPQDTGAQKGGGHGIPAAAIGGVRRYDLGTVAGVALAITDAVPLPDGSVLVSAAAEDTPNAIDDGPVVGAAVALLRDGAPAVVAALPRPDKVEGLAVRAVHDDGVSLLAVVDADDPAVPSSALDLRLRW
ncbi:DUF6910 family protein [Pseudosporangium ferrugineum]|uniref:Uncharacterized protein n=1 Tax=Pseudosporangium ferrugineum TaxID=439699 RepID=A0A2T0SIF8_9ACTN|nr:hypothetical protein [Pseudosporangium ferrugineum]PRY33204.1 hypothetical protein CLV70_101366 [Pseudosporangium ferrugineum]